MRVYELAKELGITSKEVIQKLKGLGITNINSNMNSLTKEYESSLRKAVKDGGANKREDRGSAEKDAGKKGNAPQKKESRTESRKASADHKSPAAGTGAGKAADSPAGGRQGSQNKRNDRPAKNQNQGKNENRNKGNRSDEKRAGTSGKNQKNSSGHNAEGKNNRSGKADRNAEKQGGSGRNHSGQHNKKQGSQHSDRNQEYAGSQSERRAPGNKNAKDKRSGSSSRNSNSSRPNMMKAAKPKHSHNKNQRKEQRKEARRLEEEKANAIPAGAFVVDVPITVKGLAEQIEVSPSDIIMKLMKMGIMANMNENLDADTVEILGDELGKQIIIGGVEEDSLEEGIESFEDREEDLRPRPPVITVMGHVDHGKTSLLDKIRKTDVTATESGGITQHIGASEVTHEGNRIVFLDTPGHEAFTAMRARGAYITDIAVLVVAADDSVKPQTIEAISHAKAANVPVIVAINKIDKPGANVLKVKEDLANQGILVEDWGGDVISVPVSAKTGEGIDTLLEMILLQAEMLELKANPSRLALGTVIEAKLDKQRGPVASLLIQNGTLKQGMSIVAGNCCGRIKAMTNYKGSKLKKAGPATAVEVLGLDEVPEAGDTFNAVESDKIAREIAENRKQKQREQVLQQKTSGVSLEDLFSQIKQGEVRELNLVVKADVQGSVGALVTSLEKLKNEEVSVSIVHRGVGAINESDVMLANTSNAVIIGFNVRPSSSVAALAAREQVEIRTYTVIYEIIEDVEAALKGMLTPEVKEEVIGSAEVRNTFKVPNVGTVAGAYVTDGKVERNAGIRLVRDGIVIHEGTISSLKRYKDDAKEVARGYECGIGIENFNDIKDGDVIEAYKMVEVER